MQWKNSNLNKSLLYNEKLDCKFQNIVDQFLSRVLCGDLDSDSEDESDCESQDESDSESEDFE